MEQTSWSELFQDLIVIIKEFATLIGALANIANNDDDAELLNSPEAQEVFAAGKDLLVAIIKGN